MGIGSCISLNGVYAATINDEMITPMYTTIKTTRSSLSITEKTARATTSIETKSKCNISITMKLQKKSGTSWTTVKTWEKSADNAISLRLTKDYTVSSGTYRVRSVVKAGSEQATITSTSKSVE